LQGYEGDNGPAVNAKLHAPIAIYYDKVTGSKFIAELHRCTIRMINAVGIISTIAGVAGTCDGTGFNKPFALSMNSFGSLIIADFGNNLIRQLTKGTDNTWTTITIAGGGSVSLENEGDEGFAADSHISSPSGIWVDKQDNIFIAESFSHRVRVIKKEDGKIYNVAGTPGVKGTETTLWRPRGIWGDETTHYKLFIPDTMNRRIVSIGLAIAAPSSSPSTLPSSEPSSEPTCPSSVPSSIPSSSPITSQPTNPSSAPSGSPSLSPTSAPSYVYAGGIITTIAGGEDLTTNHDGFSVITGEGVSALSDPLVAAGINN
jgi:hypothetical protein